MKVQMIDRVKKFQTTLIASGVARGVIAAPSPNLLLAPQATSEEVSEDIIFAKIIDQKELVDVCRDLYISGFYTQAVAEAFKALDKLVQCKAGKDDIAGSSLMDHVFSTKTPLLSWSDRATRSELDEQNGYQRLFSGAMLALRNPCSHEHNWIDSPKAALECIILAQHLIRKAKDAQRR